MNIHNVAVLKSTRSGKKIITNTDTKYVNNPAFSRTLLVLIVELLLVVLLGLFCRWLVAYFSNYPLDLGEWLSHLVLDGFFLIAIFSIFWSWISKNQYIITITTASLTGPFRESAFLGDPKVFPLDQVDLSRLRRKMFLGKFWYETEIWNKDKEKILISWERYSKEQEEEIVETLTLLVNRIQARG